MGLHGGDWAGDPPPGLLLQEVEMGRKRGHVAVFLADLSPQTLGFQRRCHPGYGPRVLSAHHQAPVCLGCPRGIRGRARARPPPLWVLSLSPYFTQPLSPHRPRGPLPSGHLHSHCECRPCRPPWAISTLDRQ